MDPTQMSQPMDNTANSAPQQEGSPIDGMIAQVDSYIKDPKLITPDTLMQLKSDLEDLKSVVEGGPEGEAAPQGPGLAGAISQNMGGR